MTTFVFLLIVLLTNIIQSITGFAGTVLAMPFTILLFGIDTAKPVLTALTTLACLLVVCRGLHHIAWKEFFKMALLMYLGVFAGEYLYRISSPDILLSVYAVFIILIALKGLFLKGKSELPAPYMTPVILGAGLIHGMFISGGPLLIIYAMKKIPDKEQFRTTLSLIWITLNLYLLAKQASAGLFTPSALYLLLLGIPALIAGVSLGDFTAKKMSREVFLKLTYFLLLLSGASLFL